MKHIITKTSSILLLLVAVLNAPAQVIKTSAKISGTLADAQGKPIDYATVSLLQSKDSSIVKGALSNDAGLYFFENIKPGSYIVKATMVGYIKATSAVISINENSAFTVPVLTMRANSKTLSTVNIVSAKPLIERKLDRTVMNVENSILAAGNSAMEILERAPGVTVDKDDNISLKGKQGVTVMINDKLTYLSSAQLATLLRSTDGTTIQSIEIITNPSAKYDASGNSGIINIKLKKNNQSGTNGSIVLGGGYSAYPRDNASLSLNHKQGKLNIFGNINHTDTRRSSFLQINRQVIDNAGQSTFFNQGTSMPRNMHNYSFRFGADYDLSPKNTIGVIVNGYNNKENDYNDNITRIGSTPAAIDSSLHTGSIIHQRYKNFAININDRYIIDTLGQELSFDLDYSKFNYNIGSQYNTDFHLADGSLQHPSVFLRNQSPSIINIRTAKADYTYPINKTVKFESGLKYSDVTTDNDLQAEILKTGNYINDTTRSNHFIYDEKLAAGYFNLSKSYKNTSLQIGLRAEYTNSTGNLVTKNQIVSRNYIDLFPSLFINHTLSPKNDLSFSYSRRIDRPGYDNLNPFVFYLDQYTYQQGNPFLKPQYTHNFELAYTYNKAINITLGYSRTTDIMSQILITDVVKKVTYQTDLNLQTQNSYNINFSTPYTIAKWFTGNIDATGFYNQFKSDSLLNGNLNRGKAAYHVKISQVFLFAGFKAELMESYESARIYGLYEFKPLYYMDAGISRSFADKKLNIKLAVNDILNSRKEAITTNYQASVLDIKQNFDSRTVRLNLTYNFGNSAIKARQHQTGADEESGRASR